MSVKAEKLKAEVIKGNSTRMRQDAKNYLALAMERMMARCAEGELPSLSADEKRAADFLLDIFGATIDEFQAQNPLLLENVLQTSSEDLPAMFQKARRVLS